MFSVATSLLGGCQTNSANDQKRNIAVELSDGDIAFRRGLGFVSDAVLVVNARGSYSHCGVVIHYNGEWCVVHAVPYEGDRLEDDKVYCEPIGEFYSTKKASCGAIYRMQGLDSLDREAIGSYVEHHFEAGTKFDHDYNLDNQERLYCSELVWRAYLEVGRDLSQSRRTNVKLPPFYGTHIMPADIELNDSLALIYSFIEELK
ncbi:MAG: YiiX/YebB-like N1pC/P60 family cysteine hydrolase [Rikenellaceae bacterium]